MPLLALCFSAWAVLPMPTWPECGEPDRPDLCPSDIDEDWWKIGYIPLASRESIRPAELELGSGVALDRALRTTAGRTDVAIAVLDSGFNWDNHRYINKILLNHDELPLPQDAGGIEFSDHDRDGNGIVNIQDYEADPRVSITAGRDEADGRLDPSDILAAFSDGIDDDNNGFIDDIAGWDFFNDDNDAWHDYTDDYGEHGDGVMEDVGAEGGDGDTSVGVCPNCALIPLRTGDTFVTDGLRVANAIVYAADRGVVSTSMAFGTLSAPDYVRSAVRYAHAKGVTLVGAAGDENSYHHNQPHVADEVLYVHSIRADSSNEESGVYSYFNFFNCNNYGPRIVLSADSPACATGAVAITAGAAGMVQSAAKDRGLTLSPDEVYQLLIAGSDDIWLTEAETTTAGTYPSAEGWDPFYGYGRLNVANAVEAVAAGAIPPTAALTSPGWFDTLTPYGQLSISGRVGARAGAYTWVLEMGTGHDPRSWTEVKSGAGTAAFEGELATLDLATLPGVAPSEADIDETIVGRMERVFEPAVTLRLRIEDEAGGTGQYQKTFFVREDPDLVAGFPIDLGGSAEPSPVLSDFDGDGDFEIVLATTSGQVHLFQHDGTELAGWPVEADPSLLFHGEQPSYASGDIAVHLDSFVGTTAVGDLEGDGSLDIVAVSLDGKLYVWNSDGSRKTGFPVETAWPVLFDREHVWDHGFVGGPSLADMDGDGTLEIFAISQDQQLYVWEYSGAELAPYPIAVCAPEYCDVAGTRSINTPALGDLDGDGDLDVAVGTNEAVQGGNDSISYAFDATTATLLPGWPIQERGLVNQAALLPVVGEGHPGSLALADLDGDGDLEVGSPVMLGQSPLYHHDGTIYADLSYVRTEYGEGSNAGEPSFVQMTNNPAFGDMTGDGVPDYVVGAAGTTYLLALALYNANDFQHAIGAWDGKTGAMLPGWPRQIEDLQFLVSPAVADLTGDGRAEAIMGSAGYLLHAWDLNGAEPAGWPKFTGGWMLGSPAVGDIDGDGYVEVLATTREGFLYAWHTDGHADQKIGWAGHRHDPQNTGNVHTPLPTQVGPPAVRVVEDGCGCKDDNTKESGGAAWLMLPMLFAGRRRRGA